MLCVSCEEQGRTSTTVKRIELRQCTVVDGEVTSEDVETSPKGIGQLTVLQRDLGIYGTQSCTLTVMYRHIPHGQLQSINSSRVTYNPVEGTMHIRIFHHVIIRALVDMYSLPLSAHHIIRQVVEHPVHSVATEHHISLCRSLRDQSSINIQSAVPMEINGLPCRYS